MNGHCLYLLRTKSSLLTVVLGCKHKGMINKRNLFFMVVNFPDGWAGIRAVRPRQPSRGDR